MYYYPIAKFKCSSFPGEAAPSPRCPSSVPGHPSMPGLVQPGASRCGPSTGPRSPARRVWLSFRDPSLTPPLSALPASAPPPLRAGDGLSLRACEPHDQRLHSWSRPSCAGRGLGLAWPGRRQWSVTFPSISQ